MPKVKPNDFIEGSVIDKSSIIEVKNAVEDIDLDIDGENIREEGLDRRLFQGGVITGTYPRSVLSSEPSDRLPRTRTFKRPRFPSGQLQNSLDPNHATLGFDWDPEIDTHAIVRCSMYVDNYGDRYTELNDDSWEFGLVVLKPGQSYTDGLTVGHDSYFSSVAKVWPTQRICLTGAFSGRRHQGFMKRQFALDLTDEKSDYFTGSKYPWHFSGFDPDTYPRGAWTQYAMDRASQWNSSVTLIAHITSDMSGLKLGAHRINTEGTIAVVPVYRSILSGGVGKGKIWNINITYQKFRR